MPEKKKKLSGKLFPGVLSFRTFVRVWQVKKCSSVARVLDEPYSQLIPLSGVAVAVARQST
jgi:hypothetical protein